MTYKKSGDGETWESKQKLSRYDIDIHLQEETATSRTKQEGPFLVNPGGLRW